MQNVLKLIFNIIRVFIPGLILSILVLLYSLLGVFIEEEPLLMLRGGFNNFYVTISFFFISSILSWILAFSVFKYSRVFSRRIYYILVPIISTVSIIFFLVTYYVTIFYYLTGLFIFEVDFLFASTLEKSLATTILIILNFSIFISLFANLISILIVRKKPKINEENKTESSNDKDGSESSSGSFEDTISI